ncbi:MAG TPA: UDP-N-acetylglucosamine 2-epimerase [Phycisphaerae bacterium]|nr:UDP-N-acetylglucosamine 2-epimerase [Phycisphaerae bacterium]
MNRDVPFPTPWLNSIAVITTSRADAGIYRPLLSALTNEFHGQTIGLVGGNHQSAEFGSTSGHLPQHARLQLVPVEHFVPGESPADVARTAGQAVIAFSSAIDKHQPDLVFVLGDRTEMLAAALAALIHKVPIAHLHGGDATLGAYDEQCRHAITKLSHLHFPALPEHARQIEAMGEEPWRIHVVGALALDAMRTFKPLPADALSSRLGLDVTQPTVVVAFHPETLSPVPPDQQINELLVAFDKLDINLLMIGPNADVGHAAFQTRLRHFAAARPRRACTPSLSQDEFWTCLSHAVALVGNSSAGLLEAASFRLPVVNIGDRQRGRIFPKNVIHTETNAKGIERAIAKVISPAFRSTLADLVNPYGDGRAAERILDVLKTLPDRHPLLQKGWR